MNASDITDLTESLSDFFTGYNRRNPGELTKLASLSGWAVIAQREVENRAYAMMTALPTAELNAIASGAIDVQDLIQNIIRESHESGV